MARKKKEVEEAIPQSNCDVVLKFKKLNENAVIPSIAKAGDAGMDVVATEVEYDYLHDTIICHTGLACEFPKGYVLLAFPRSSVTNKGCLLGNSVGVIDSGYRGEIQLRYKMHISFKVKRFHQIVMRVLYDKNPFKSFGKLVDNEVNKGFRVEDIYYPYKAGDRVGQFILMKLPDVQVEEVTELTESDRGDGGFGSSGN